MLLEICVLDPFIIIRILPMKWNLYHSGYPRHRENRENGNKKIPVGENTGNFVKTHGILLAQVVNVLILKVEEAR